MMFYRKIAAHFAWSADDRIVKKPLLVFDEDHRLVDFIEYGDRFTETAGVEFFNGLLIPGFIGDISLEDVNNVALIHRLLRNGYIYLRSNASFQRSTGKYPIVLKDENILSTSSFAWEELLQFVRNNEPLDVLDWINQSLTQPWQNSCFKEGGLFEVGRFPGVLQINGIQWDKMKFTSSPSLKIIL